MRLSIREVAGAVIIDVEGKIVLGQGDAEIKEAVEELLKKGKKDLVLNMAKVSYLDSAGLGELIRCFTALRRSGGNLKLVALNQRIIELLTLTKLLNVFDCYGDEETALKSFS